MYLIAQIRPTQSYTAYLRQWGKYEVNTVNDFRSGKLKSTTNSKTLHGSGHEIEIGWLTAANTGVTGNDGPLIEMPQIAVFASGDVNMGSKVDPTRPIEIINMAEANELIKLITLGQSLPGLKDADPSKIEEINGRVDRYAEEKAKQMLQIGPDAKGAAENRIPHILMRGLIQGHLTNLRRSISQIRHRYIKISRA